MPGKRRVNGRIRRAAATVARRALRCALPVIYARNVERGYSGVNISYPDYLDWRRLKTFAGVEVFNWWSLTLSGDGDAERVAGAQVSPGVFSLLGVEPLLGRGFAAGDDVPGRDRVIVIGHGLWQRRFGADPSAVGRAVRVDGEPYTIVGVMPQSFRFPYEGEAWIPLTPVGDHYEGRGNRLDSEARIPRQRSSMNRINRS